MTGVFTGVDGDDVLVERARLGDVEAFGELVRRHEATARRVAIVVLATPEGADDVLQEASVRALRGLDGFRKGSSFRPWYLRIVANGARNERRSRGRRQRLTQRVAARRVLSGAGPEEAAVTEDERAAVAAALGRLPELDRLVLVLRHVEQLSEAEMAMVLDCAPGTVKSRLSRALGKLRRELVGMAIAVLVAAAIAIMAITPAREAVADWFGVGSTSVRRTPAPADVGADQGGVLGELPALDAGARVVDAATAEAALGRPLELLHPDTDAVPEYAIPAEGGVLVRWPGNDETLWLHSQTADSVVLLTKLIGIDAEVARIDDLGDDALWLGGPHVLETPGRAVAARNVVLWIADGLDWRLEGDLDRSSMERLARELASR